MSRPKVLYVAHNHPTIRPGGAEAYALELYEAMRYPGRYEPMLLARTGQPVSKGQRYHEGTLLTGVGDDPNQYFFYTEFEEYNWLLGTSTNKPVITRFFREFLEAVQPDLVHFQHTLFFGYDAIRQVRNALPGVPIVYTLHEFLPICHRQGQLLRVGSDEPCMEESPRRCHECYPQTPPQEFFLRKRFIQAQLSLVDLFLAPSHFLRDRYVDWGLEPDRIRFEDYGRTVTTTPAPGGRRKRRNRLAFFGQVSHYKGVNVLLAAIKRIAEEGLDVRLSVHGANLELQPQDFQDQFDALLAACGDTVSFEGSYDHDQLPALMENADWVIVPSIWWENSPLVIQEAFQHGRPVICSDIGGMAEKVTDGVDGLHFRAGDPESLARVISRALAKPELWRELRAGIQPVYTMSEHIDTLSGIYDVLIADRASAAAATLTGAAR
ncbi:MAG: glycosyltransferase family 4 protein [bacterium]